MGASAGLDGRSLNAWQLAHAESALRFRVFVTVAPLDMRGSFDARAGAERRLGLDQ
jgi:hypothetical protein